MLTVIIFIMLIMFTVAALQVLAKIFLYGLVAVVLAIQFLARKLYAALPWVGAASLAVAFTIHALWRQVFFREDAKLLIAERLPPRENVRGRSLALLTIEHMLAIREIIAAR